MKYPQIISKVYREFWALTAEKHEAIMRALEMRIENGPNATLMPEGYDPEKDFDEPDYCEIEGRTAVIKIHGVLGKHLSGIEMMCGGCSMEQVSKMLDAADASPRIKNIVLAFNSPGGTVTGTPELGDKIADIGTRKRMIAFTDADCCSGAYWLASQCETIYATKSAVIGSVGVRMILLDCTKALESEGVKVNPITSGKYKISGASFKPLEPDEREMFQAESDRIHNEFKSAVTINREIDPECLQGQVFRGEIAVTNGMIDGLVDDLDDVLEGLPVDSPAMLNGDF